IVIGEYLGLLVPALAPLKIWLACGVVIGFALIQWRGIRIGGEIQNLTTGAKALIFIALVIACFVFPSQAPVTHPAPTLPHGTGLLVAFILSMQAVIYTYDGWAGIVYFSEETKDPDHDVPRSMFLGTLSVIAIYLLLSAATIKVMPIGEIRGDV